MASRRLFRLIEATFVVLFFLEALRMTIAMLLESLNVAFTVRVVDPILATSHIVLIIAIAVLWLIPRSRSLLPIKSCFKVRS